MARSPPAARTGLRAISAGHSTSQLRARRPEHHLISQHAGLQRFPARPHIHSGETPSPPSRTHRGKVLRERGRRRLVALKGPKADPWGAAPVPVQGQGRGGESIDLQAICGRRMPGKAPGRDEYGVASKGEAGRPRVPRQPDPRGSRNSPPLRRADRNRGDLEISARFDLDKGDRSAPSRDEIDFAARYQQTAARESCSP